MLKGLKEIIFIADKGPWYNLLEEKGLRRIKLKFHVRGYIEKFFRYIKDVIKRFDNQGFQSKAIHSKKVKRLES